MAVSALPCAPPRHKAPNLYRPIFSTLKAIKCPFPISPNKFSTGTATFSKNICLVEEPLIPIFSSSSPKVNPGVFLSTINPVNFSPPIFAKTMKISAKPALEIHIFCPFKMYFVPSSLKSALVLAANASDPDPGSVKQ